MFRRSVSLKSSGRLVVRVTMAYNNQEADSYASRTEGGHKRQGNRGRGGFPNPNAKPYEGYGERPMEAFSKGFPMSEAPKNNGVKGSQFSNDRSHQNYGNNPKLPGSYPHGEGSGNGRDRGQGRGYRNDNRDRAQPYHYHGDTQKVNRDQRHQQRVQPGPDQFFSQKGNRTQNRGQLAQSGPNQGDSQKGDTSLKNSVKGDMAQGYRQGAQAYSYQGDSQEGSGWAQGHVQGAEPFSYQGDSQEVSGWAPGHVQGAEPLSYQGDSQEGSGGAPGHGQGAEPFSYQGDSQEGSGGAPGHGQGAEPFSYQGDSQEGSGGAPGHGQGAEPFSYQGDSQEGSDGTPGHGQGAEPFSYQGDTQENIDRGQHNENDSRQGFQAVFVQKDLQKGTEGDMAQALEQGIEPGSHKGDSQEVKPFSDQKISQKGKEWNHAQGASSSKGNLKEGNDTCQSHGNNSIQKTHQKDSQKGSDRVQSHGNDSGPWNKHGPNQGSSRKGEDRSVGHYQDNRSHSYQGQKDSGYEGRYSRQASSGGGSRRDNSDQQQRKRNRADDEDDIFLSKTLSFILRHGAEKLKFKLMPGGFLYVDEILKHMQKLEGFTVEDVQRVVAQNDKQRFAIQKDGTGRLKIRANQGHTVEVEDLELTPITSADQVLMVLHGTYYDAWNSIKKQGLCRFKRNHIHFAAGEPGENGVISGMRSSCEVLIYIDLEKALKDDLKFYLSANKVILSPGNEQGYIYPCYFKAVVNRYPIHILEFDPNIKGKTVTADQISNELEKKKKKTNKKKNKNKNKEDRENNKSGAPGEEIEGVGDTNLLAEAEEKSKENIEGKDEEDQFVDAIENQPEKLMQIHVPDQWDDGEKIEPDRKAFINSKGTEQSEGTQEHAESEDPKGTKETKSKEKDSWSETSKGAKSKSPKGAIKPETKQGSEIPEAEQKAIKEVTSTLKDEDKGAPTVATEDAEDVKIEEEWTTVSITSVEESQSAVDYILDLKQKEPVSIICSGEKQGEADGKITVLVISMKGRSWIYQLCNMEEDLMEAGKLKQLFFDTELMKVFHDVTWQSAVLFKQYEIVLDGTKVFDSNVVCKQKLFDDKAMDRLRLEGFMPIRWMEEDGKIHSSKWTQNPLDKELLNKFVERCKALLQFYKIFTMQKLPQPRKEIYSEVNKYVDKERSKEIKKNFKSQAEKKPPQEQPTSSSKEQKKGGSQRKTQKKRGK
ncbi:hypothetical protein CHS0354_042767 [Potamilus streckersoni]|uniref:2'-phosphotransferase n=1 Tax=Potamilus streckersoni TaxID=2493646 RepID=A0AAE0VSW2_9BIVA|nr:hypothetical protein CHS0354_042767 [Potamilus streckersoni]